MASLTPSPRTGEGVRDEGKALVAKVSGLIYIGVTEAGGWRVAAHRSFSILDLSGHGCVSFYPF